MLKKWGIISCWSLLMKIFLDIEMGYRYLHFALSCICICSPHFLAFIVDHCPHVLTILDVSSLCFVMGIGLESDDVVLAISDL